jgi:hypothetical protein
MTKKLDKSVYMTEEELAFDKIRNKLPNFDSPSEVFYGVRNFPSAYSSWMASIKLKHPIMYVLWYKWWLMRGVPPAVVICWNTKGCQALAQFTANVPWNSGVVATEVQMATEPNNLPDPLFIESAAECCTMLLPDGFDPPPPPTTPTTGITASSPVTPTTGTTAGCPTADPTASPTADPTASPTADPTASPTTGTTAGGPTAGGTPQFPITIGGGGGSGGWPGFPFGLAPPPIDDPCAVHIFKCEDDQWSRITVLSPQTWTGTTAQVSIGVYGACKFYLDPADAEKIADVFGRDIFLNAKANKR